MRHLATEVLRKCCRGATYDLKICSCLTKLAAKRYCLPEQIDLDNVTSFFNMQSGFPNFFTGLVRPRLFCILLCSYPGTLSMCIRRWSAAHFNVNKAWPTLNSHRTLNADWKINFMGSLSGLLAAETLSWFVQFLQKPAQHLGWKTWFPPAQVISEHSFLFTTTFPWVHAWLSWVNNHYLTNWSKPMKKDIVPDILGHMLFVYKTWHRDFLCQRYGVISWRFGRW